MCIYTDIFICMYLYIHVYICYIYIYIYVNNVCPYVTFACHMYSIWFYFVCSTPCSHISRAKNIFSQFVDQNVCCCVFYFFIFLKMSQKLPKCPYWKVGWASVGLPNTKFMILLVVKSWVYCPCCSLGTTSNSRNKTCQYGHAHTKHS